MYTVQPLNFRWTEPVVAYINLLYLFQKHYGRFKACSGYAVLASQNGTLLMFFIYVQHFVSSSAMNIKLRDSTLTRNRIETMYGNCDTEILPRNARAPLLPVNYPFQVTFFGRPAVNYPFPGHMWRAMSLIVASRVGRNQMNWRRQYFQPPLRCGWQYGPLWFRFLRSHSQIVP